MIHPAGGSAPSSLAARRPQMKAVVMREFGGPAVLELSAVPCPEPGPGAVRVAVGAVAVNAARDVATRGGRHPFSKALTLPHVLGGEHAGRVDAVGEGVDAGLVGRRVAVAAAIPCGRCGWCVAGADEACPRSQLIGIHRQGAYAEQAIAPVGNVLALRDDVSAVQGAVLVTTGPVALAQLEATGARAGDAIVVSGVTGALGSMVAALAARRDIRVVGLTRDAGRATGLPLAVTAIVDAAEDGLAERIREACDGSAPQAIVDNICAPATWAAFCDVLRPGGRVVISGAVGDATLRLDPRRLYLANHAIVGVRTGNRAKVHAFWREVDDGFRVPGGLVKSFALDEAADVHALVEAAGKTGHFALVTELPPTA